ncbi:hypothetical protein [Pseudoalteromonas luteoviolacea]|uniref:Uncharacterized protein n=1 Tax=Pseudoalteromonas luteoviolacea H33 TaxID=1365251 RepID=A0A167EAQ8_9GAMM|nr:hypothetical protein [Pseudoalteromonas luteoviolacea]KZN50325.1 hypothetical protein N476_02215 [Pseudoalteromonas luteoviolacea H33]KZN73127.1 hypothetical protein N477_02700 [Pseudoalteromonas luteoviolacea H33-S]MBQ4879697.1 hypothetical protein [Pseudoalteromonas luteoviolacea]MBQ4908759.1 hypothetical protein [Pseudoalteromonas luteoviolacea]
MDELINLAAWFSIGFGCFVVFSFLYLFKERWVQLVFAGNTSLKTKSDHELHSCFLTAFVTVASFILFHQLLEFLPSLQIDKMVKRQILYFVAASGSASFIIALTLLHAIRECTFSQDARYACYLSFAAMLIKTVQLVLYGYLDIEWFYPYYMLSILVLSTAQSLLVAKYPFNCFMQRKYAKDY